MLLLHNGQAVLEVKMQGLGDSQSGKHVYPSKGDMRASSAWVKLALACMLALVMPHLYAAEPWQVVQAVARSKAADAVAQHFAKWLPEYLGEPAMLHVQSRGQEELALNWATAEAPRQRTLVLASGALLDKVQHLAGAERDPRVLVPLQMVLEGSWCLRIPAQPVVRDYADLKAWLDGLPSPVRIGVPNEHGVLKLWVKAMERKTGLAWQTYTVSSGGAALQGLVQGRWDVVLDHCMEPASYPVAAEKAAWQQQTQLLARTGGTAGIATKSFGDWMLPSLAPDWMAWFAPVGLQAARQQQLGAALHQIMLRQDTQALIASMERRPLTRTPQESMEHVRQLQREWRQLMLWLESTADPQHSMASTGTH